MNLNIENRSKIEKMICGALQSAIDAHGPITKDNKNSAAKRILGQLRSEAKEQNATITKNNGPVIRPIKNA